MTPEHAYKEIAPRLRGLREAVDLTIEELAKKTGIPPQQVTAYESGATEIPVSYLVDVARVCGVDLTEILSGGEAHLHSYCLVKKDKGLSVERRKDYDYKSLAYKFVGRHMEPFLVRVPPKDESQLNFNTHNGQEFIFILEGRLEVRLDKNVEIMEPGDCLYFSSVTPHALRGLDGKDALFLDVIM